MLYSVGKSACEARAASPDKACFLGTPPADMECGVFAFLVIGLPILIIVLIVLIAVIFGVKSIRTKVMPYRRRERFVPTGKGIY